MSRKDLKNFIKILQSIKLSESERSLLRSKISEFISFNPIRDNVEVPGHRSYLTVFAVRHFAKGLALVLILAIVVGGSGVSYAASSALPGDKLYNIKVNVNEKIEDGLAFTPEAKIAVSSKKVERRLEETQALVKQNKLSDDNKKIVEDKLSEHVSDITKEIDALKKEGDVAVVLDTTAKLTPVLEAHKEILKEQDGKTATIVAKVEDTIRTVEEQENSIIDTVGSGEETLAIAASASAESDQGTSASQSEDTSDTSDMSSEEVLTKEAHDELNQISEEISSLVKDRIRAAEENVRNVKKEIEKYQESETKVHEALNAQDKSAIEDNTDPEVIGSASAQKDQTVTTDGSSVTDNEIKDLSEDSTKVSITDTAVSAVKNLATKTVTSTANSTEDFENDAPVKEGMPQDGAVVTKTDVSNQTKTENKFDATAKLKEAEKYLQEARDAFDQGKFKNALSLAQKVNKLTKEIEVYYHLKSLELAAMQIPEGVNLGALGKAEAVSAIK